MELLVDLEDEVVVLELVASLGEVVQYKGYHQSQISPDVPMLYFFVLGMLKKMCVLHFE